jgi:nicotinate-nucleotide pyrophosphorylase (carboxylating)
VEHLDKIIRQALEEDLKQQGDITSILLIEEDAHAKANIIAKEDFVLAGTLPATRVFKILDPEIDINTILSNGDKVRNGDVIITLNGRLRSILAGERVALNFLQRLCGIATITNKFAAAAKGYGVKVTDTRKTTPILRFLEKEAVAAGGGYNHRMGLYDRILIKDNHIKHCRGVGRAVTAAKEKSLGRMDIEVETKNLDEVKEAVMAGADIIMFDNMPPKMVKNALEIVGKNALTEISGGVTLDNIRKYAATKPDYISIGALTHSAKAVDISLLIE